MRRDLVAACLIIGGLTFGILGTVNHQLIPLRPMGSVMLGFGLSMIANPPRP